MHFVINGWVDDQVEYTIVKAQLSAVGTAFVIWGRIDKDLSKVAIIKNVPEIILAGLSAKDHINGSTSDKYTFAHDVSDKLVVMGD